MTARAKVWTLRLASVKQQDGFTLTEIIVAIAIMAILAAIAIPNWSTLMPTYALNSGARQVQSELHLAKSRAISMNTRFDVVFAATSYQVRRNTGTCDTANYPDADSTKALPDGISVSSPPTICFTSRGTSNGGTVSLCNNKSAGKNVVVSDLGRIQINDASC